MSMQFIFLITSVLLVNLFQGTGICTTSLNISTRLTSLLILTVLWLVDALPTPALFVLKLNIILNSILNFTAVYILLCFLNTLIIVQYITIISNSKPFVRYKRGLFNISVSYSYIYWIVFFIILLYTGVFIALFIL